MCLLGCSVCRAEEFFQISNAHVPKSIASSLKRRGSINLASSDANHSRSHQLSFSRPAPAIWSWHWKSSAVHSTVTTIGPWAQEVREPRQIPEPHSVAGTDSTLSCFIGLTNSASCFRASGLGQRRLRRVLVCSQVLATMIMLEQIFSSVILQCSRYTGKHRPHMCALCPRLRKSPGLCPTLA